MKNGQVTFFIILGLLLVMIIGTIVFISIPSTPVRTPAEFAPVEVMLNSCTEQVLRENIQLAALAGGSLEIAILFDKVSQSDMSLLSEKHITFTNNLDAVPLLLYYNTPCTSSSCIMTLKPSLHGNFNQRDFGYVSNDMSVEAQLSRISSVMIADCVNNRISQNEVFSADNLNVALKNIINDNGVSYEVRLMGSIRTTGSTTSNVYASGSISSTFKSLYDAVGSMTILERDTGFSSFMIMDIISLDSSIKGNYPPFWALDLGYSINSWTSNEISQKLKEDMDTYFSLVRLSDSQLESSFSEDNIPYVLKRSIIDMKKNDNSYFGDDIILSYLPTYSNPEVSFSGKKFIRGEPMEIPISLVASILPIRTYRTYYNIRTPIIYELQSKEDGLVFRYAVESLIQSNLPVYGNSFPYIPPTDFGFDASEQSILSSAFCDSPQGSNLNVNIYDASNGRSIDNALLIFSCEQTSCSYEYDNSPIRVPPCLNAVMSVFYEDYSFNTIEVDTFDYYTSRSLSFDGYLSEEIGVNVALLPAILTSNNPYYSFTTSSPRQLEGQEIVIISLINSDTGTSHATIVTAMGMQQPLLLTPGYYEIDIVVMRDLGDRSILIPEQERCAWGNPSFLCIGRHTIEEVKMENTLLLSSVSYGSSESLYVSSNDLNSGSDIYLLIPIADLEQLAQNNRKIEHLSFLGEADIFMRSHGIMEVD